MKAISSKIGTIIIIGIFLFIGLKSCIKTGMTLNKTEVYQQVNESGESNRVYIAPGNTIILKKQFEDQYEYGVYHVKGVNVTHYFGPLYHRGESLLGFRIYPNAKDVWDVEMELMDKGGNLTNSTFKEIGTSFRDLLIFRDNSVEIGNYTYNKTNKTSQDDQFIKLAVLRMQNKP